MANNKWAKWIVGLSSAALFTGFVGVIGGASADQTSAVQTNVSDETASSGTDTLWTAPGQSAQSDTGSRFNSSSSGRSGSSSNQAQTTGRMRTHAS